MAQTNNILVVGGSSGVGLAAARLALSNLPNAKVIISSRSEDKLKTAVEEIKSSVKGKDSEVGYVVGDMSNFDKTFDDVEAVLKQATEWFGGKIDHIVWTAGARPSPSIGERSNQDIIDASTPRLFAPLTLTSFAKTYMNDSTHSSITLTSGVLAYRPRPGIARVVGAAGGMESSARALAVDLAPIRTNTIVLGAIDTPLLQQMAQSQPGVLDHLANATLAKRIGTADEAAEAYLYLMRCSYATGTSIDVEGGFLLC